MTIHPWPNRQIPLLHKTAGRTMLAATYAWGYGYRDRTNGTTTGIDKIQADALTWYHDGWSCRDEEITASKLAWDRRRPQR